MGKSRLSQATIQTDNSAWRSRTLGWELSRKCCRKFSTRSNKEAGLSLGAWVWDWPSARPWWKRTRARSLQKAPDETKARRSRWFFPRVKKRKHRLPLPWRQDLRSASPCEFCLLKITKTQTVRLRICSGGEVITCNRRSLFNPRSTSAQRSNLMCSSATWDYPTGVEL